MDFSTFIEQKFSSFSLGAFLGPDISVEEQKLSGKQGKIVFTYFGIIPKEFDVPECYCGNQCIGSQI